MSASFLRNAITNFSVNSQSNVHQSVEVAITVENGEKNEG